MIQRSPMSSRPFCPLGWCKTDLMTALHTLHSIREQESEQLIGWADKSMGGARLLTWWTTLPATLLILLTHRLRWQTAADHSRESGKLKFRSFLAEMEEIWEKIDALSVSATLTVMKSLCPHTLRRCFDKHTICTKQMNHLLDMHRSNNHYLASS